MKFNNILVVLNPENDKQYALARAVRLAKEKKVQIPSKLPYSLPFMPYLMKCQLYFLQKSVKKCITM